MSERNEYVEYEELYGSHVLTGVDIIEDTGDGAKCIFTLDGIHYEAVENPDDGYRSYLGYIRTTETAPRVTFEEEKVIVCGWESRGTEGLQILSAHTGDPILIVGTRNIDDYYPCCTMYYTPENLYANIQANCKR